LGVAGALDQLRDAAAGEANLMPGILDAVRAGATVGEVSQVFAGVFGEYRA
jgi:methylmalonyl-CoA mutase N-terminal domain/subunit